MKLAKLLTIVGIVLIPALGMARDEPAPDMEILEFLGGFETARGKPVDPLGFADYAQKENKKESPDTAKKDRKRSRKPEKQEQKERDNEK
jgi:hypothetical protein